MALLRLETYIMAKSPTKGTDEKPKSICSTSFVLFPTPRFAGPLEGRLHLARSAEPLQIVCASPSVTNWLSKHAGTSKGSYVQQVVLYGWRSSPLQGVWYRWCVHAVLVPLQTLIMPRPGL